MPDLNSLSNNSRVALRSLVSIRNLHFSRGKRPIFKDINIEVQQGKITAVMGPSGTGKTTLLRLIGAQLRPQSGTVKFLDKNMHRLSQRELYAMRKKMGMLFQTGALFTNLSVFENVAFPLREHTQLPETLIRDLVLMKLEAVGLRGAHALMPNELSGGMARRVALARTIALDPQLIMYDEPLAGQDPITKGIVTKLIRELNQALNATSIIVSHDVAETLAIADYVYIVSGGRILAEGPPKTIQASALPEAEQFLHGLPDGAIPFHYPTQRSYMEELISD